MNFSKNIVEIVQQATTEKSDEKAKSIEFELLEKCSNNSFRSFILYIMTFFSLKILQLVPICLM